MSPDRNTLSNLEIRPCVKNRELHLYVYDVQKWRQGLSLRWNFHQKLLPICQKWVCRLYLNSKRVIFTLMYWTLCFLALSLHDMSTFSHNIKRLCDPSHHQKREIHICIEFLTGHENKESIMTVFYWSLWTPSVWICEKHRECHEHTSFP